MPTKTFEMKIKLPSGGLLQSIRVQADSAPKAKEMAELQYGKGCVRNGPYLVKN